MLSESFLPKFELRNHRLICDTTVVSLHRRPMGRRLLEAFIAHPDIPLSRDELVNWVYHSFNPANKSERFNAALARNITKIISRTRSHLERAHNRKHQWIEFFPYDYSSGAWHLYRLTQGYILERLERAVGEN